MQNKASKLFSIIVILAMMFSFTSTSATAAPIQGGSLPAVGPVIVINEFSASTTGTDVEFVEIFGTPSTDFSTYKVLEIEGDNATSLGMVDEVISIGTTNASGFYLASLAANALENGTLTLLLVSGFSGAAGNDLDTDNDGVFDTTPWSAIVDAVAVNDGGAGDRTYGVPSLGVAYDGLSFAPGGASRIPDGLDTNAATDWVRNDFDLAGIPGFTGTLVVGEAYNTPGATNQAYTVAGNIVTIEATDGDAAEAASATGNFRISRTGDTTSALTVNYTPSGTASAPDYGPALGGTVEIPAGSAYVDILITPVDDADVEGPETLTLTLATGSGYTLGAVTSASVTIADNDAAVVVTPIHDIQGNGSTSIAGTFTVDAIVVGDYQAQTSGQLKGFFIQEEDADVDADPATSEGIFVYCYTCPTAVNVGDKVRVTGATSEYYLMSQINATTAGSVSVLSSDNQLPTPASLTLPIPGVPTGDLAAAETLINAYYEAFEGMLVKFPATLSVSEYFELARYGQVILSAGGRPHTFTAVNIPTASGYIDHQIDLAARSIILDDPDNRENRPIVVPNTAYYHPVPGLSTTNYFRGGDTITNLTGVLHWSYNGTTGTDAWRIRPVTEKYSYAFTPVNTRPAAPIASGRLKVASFNVLNYFLTIDTSNVCAPTLDQDCRGADSAQELSRQRTKMLAALSAIDADVFGFMEMENTPGVEPLADIVAGLPGYGYIDTGVIGTDAIRVGIIYKTSTVTPVGDFKLLTSAVDPRFDDTKNRPALAQTFEEIATGGRFTVVVNHLKSKGSSCGAGDDDTTTGQGNCNLTRTLAAQAMADWLATDPTGAGDPDYLIIGDLNSYAMEDPIVALQDAGYTDMVAEFGGADAYGYVYDGQLGYLDHALANSNLYPQVTGVAELHINADEIPLFDYNDDERTADEATYEEESDVLPLYEANEFRTSDHDPVIIGLNLDATPPVVTVPANMTVEATSAAGAVVNYPAATATDETAPANPVVTCAPASGSTFPLGINTVNCEATDNAGNTGYGSFTITVEDTTDPILTVPANMAVSPTSWAGAVVNFTATATDTVDPNPVVACVLPSGSTFPFGVNTVNCTATDASGNVANGSFTITVGGTAYTLKFRSNGANDGAVRESTETSNLSNYTDPLNQLIAVGDDYLKRQYVGILDFNTANLPDNAVITSVKLQVKVMVLSNGVYTSLGELLADVTNPYFGNLPSLQTTDFRSRALVNNVGSFTRATDGNQWITLLMKPTSLFAVNKTGQTQFRLRFGLDDNNDSIKDRIGFLSGNYPVVAGRPLLIITYYIPQVTETSK